MKGTTATAVFSKKKKPAKPKLGLRACMDRVLIECDRAAGLEADPVHDLRVALRRCRSLADGMIAIDPHPGWKNMKKAGKKLFQALGELRDMQIMQEWMEKLGPFLEGGGDLGSRGLVRGETLIKSEPSAQTTGYTEVHRGTERLNSSFSGDARSGDLAMVKLLNHTRAREASCKQTALRDLNQFDRRQWQQWARTLPQRVARVRPGSVVYQHLALEKWTAAHELHKRALRSRSQVGWHALRIGIKRFRYTVENFLPRQHEAWGGDLKGVQDALGEVHDLDVLWATGVACGAFADAESRRRWREILNAERDERIARYRAKMVGGESLWPVWRAELPTGDKLRSAAMTRLRTWAGYVDPDSAHSQRVTQLALRVYDGLSAAGLLKSAVPIHAATRRLARGEANPDWRTILQAAAIMHDVGKFKRQSKHQKTSYRMIRGLARPLGWSARELELAALVARYHRGALPHPRRKIMQVIEIGDRAMAIKLAGILRLANALDSQHDRDGGAGGVAGPVRGSRSGVATKTVAPKIVTPKIASSKVEVDVREGSVFLLVEGYSPLKHSAERIAAARHLLESSLRLPIIVRALRVEGRRLVRTG